MTIRSRMSSIMAVIGFERLQLFAIELEKIPIFYFVYTLASTIVNQTAPNLIRRYRAIRSRVSSIMGVIGPEQLELFALEFEKLLYLTLFIYTIASTNINQFVLKFFPNIYHSKISFECDYGCNRTRTSGVICP